MKCEITINTLTGVSKKTNTPYSIEQLEILLPDGSKYSINTSTLSGYNTRLIGVLYNEILRKENKQ